MQGIPKKRFGLSCCPAAGACKVDVGTDGVFRGLCAARCPRLATNGQWEEICFAKLGALVGCSETWKTSRMISVMCRFMSCEVISVRPDVHAICRYAIGVILTLALGWASSASEQVHRYPLTSVQGLTLHNVTAGPVTLDGRPGLRVAIPMKHSKGFSS
jgi:hypothetical protein